MDQPLVRHWVGHGSVCIQPNDAGSRALTGRSGPGTGSFADWASRPKDIAFLRDALHEIEAKVPALRGKRKRAATGVGGHSFGADTAQLVAGATAAPSGLLRRSPAAGNPSAVDERLLPL